VAAFDAPLESTEEVGREKENAKKETKTTAVNKREGKRKKGGKWKQALQAEVTGFNPSPTT
jgi:hypothetical protein